MEIYIPYVVGSTAIGILSKGVFNYMYKDNSDIMNMEIIDNDSDIKKDYFDIETIENTKEEPIDNSKEEPIEESKKIESIEETNEESIESAYKIKNKKIKCYGCKTYLKLSSYSKTQNKLGEKSRCKVCIKLSY
jgi:hypothetical protein